MEKQTMQDLTYQENSSKETNKNGASSMKDTLKQLEYEYMHGHKCNFMGASYGEASIRYEE